MPDYSELFKLDSADKQFSITTDGVVITNGDLYSESFELSEILCSNNQLKFGECNASSIKFKTSNISTYLKDRVLTVSVSINNETAYQIGKYKVFSDTPTADHRYREIVAYDAMYDILNTNVSDWYKYNFSNVESVTLKQFRDSFFTYLGVEQEVVTLPQDTMTVEETIGGEDISGRTIITAICEINGCFGHIGRDGKFQYVFLEEMGDGLFPALTLYPQDGLYPEPLKNTTNIDSAYYYEAGYDDFISKSINKLQIRQSENDIGYILGTGNNCYIVEDNILVYGKTPLQLADIAQTLFEKIQGVSYRPATVKAKADLTIPVGAIISLETRYKKINTYILERSTKGIQLLIDEYKAQGTEYQEENVNSVNRSLFQLKGKTNELERTVEETRATITDVEAGLESEIRQTASALETTLKAYSETQANLARTNAGNDTDAKLANYSTTTQMNSAIQQSASNITTSVASTYATQASVQTQIDNLQAQIDDSIDTFTGPDVPTLNNYPAEDWTTTHLKDQHVGDLYIVNSEGGSYAGYYYRFEKANNVYQWSILDDTEVSKALADAGAALALAQGVAEDLSVNYYTKSQTDSQISQSAGTITSTVSATYETKVDATNKLNTAKGYAEDYTDEKLTLYSNTAQMNSAISQSASNITSSVAATYETKSNANTRYTALSSSISQNADSITAEVTRAQDAEAQLSASISVNTDAINLKVSKGDVSSQISQEAGQITINSNRISINSDNFTLRPDGTIIASNATLNGTVNASTGWIGSFRIGASAIYNGKEALNSGNAGVYIGVDGICVGPATQYGITKILADGSFYAGNGEFVVNTFGDVYVGRYSNDRTTVKGGTIETKIINVDSYGHVYVGNSIRLENNSLYMGSSSYANVMLTTAGISWKNTANIESTNINIGTGSWNAISIGSGTHSTTTIGAGSSTVVYISGSESYVGTASSATTYVGTNSNCKTYIGTGSSGTIGIGTGSSPTITIGSGQYGTVTIGSTSGYDVKLQTNTSHTVQICTSTNQKVGFFGSSGHSRTTVSNISSTSSASTSTIATKVNELLNALRGYGLIG